MSPDSYGKKSFRQKVLPAKSLCDRKSMGQKVAAPKSLYGKMGAPKSLRPNVPAPKQPDTDCSCTHQTDKLDQCN